ncbi:MAG: hypothetical protein AAF617_07520 [Bacteroidota bacterium]
MTNDNKPNGCFVSFQRLFSAMLAIFATLFVGGILLFVTYEIQLKGISLLVLTVSSFFVLRYLWKNVKRKSTSNKEVFKGIVGDFIRTVCVFVLFAVIMGILIENVGYYKKDPIPKKKDADSSEIVTTTENGKEMRYVINKQNWRDFEGDWHQMDFKIAESDIPKSKKNRHNFRYTRNFSWGNFYKHMADHDRLMLTHLYDSFRKIQQQKKLNRKQFAELIITSIQDIQYNYIKSSPCDGSEDFPCVGNVRLGIFAPVEFSANLQGDCDSRTVLLFVLLSKFNYDVAILNSHQYKHSILGINIPSRGKYKLRNRKKYYFVETTAKRCVIGYLPPKVSNINYWNFVLVNKN